MIKCFNKERINKIIGEYPFITSEEIINKKAYKKSKIEINNIKGIKLLYNYLSKEEFNNMIKRFFPLKYEELVLGTTRGIPFTTTNAYYFNEDEKIYWVVNQGSNERIFKLKTTNYLDRTEEERKKVLNIVKNKLDKLYGFFKVPTTNGYFITDCNKNKDGSYKKLVEVDNTYGLAASNSSTFCDRFRESDLIEIN